MFLHTHKVACCGKASNDETPSRSYQYVAGFESSVQDAVAVHMVHGKHKLITEGLDCICGQSPGLHVCVEIMDNMLADDIHRAIGNESVQKGNYVGAHGI
jgi:hypothetical protein